MKIWIGRKAAAILTLGFSVNMIARGQENGQVAVLPSQVTEEHFQELLERSPFTRSLSLYGTLVLTGVAEVDGKPMATILDIEYGRTMVISESPDQWGWRMVELRKKENIEYAVAIIAIDSGETVSVYHNEKLIKDAGQRTRFVVGAPGQQIATRGASNTLPDWVNQMEDPVLKGLMIQNIIESGAYDAAPFEAVDMALSLQEPQSRGPAVSAAFGRLGGGVGGVDRAAAVARLNSLPAGRDRDFAINGLAHGMVGSDPQGALKWANSISQKGFRDVVVRNINRRIEARPSR